MRTTLAAFAFLISLVLAACQSHGSSLSAIPDSNTAQLCELDLHCAAGMHCQAGVCDFGCQTDADCGGQGSCDSRGRCGPEPTAPEPFAGKLVSKVNRVALPLNVRTAAAHIENQGKADIAHFHVVSDDPAVSASPARGSLPAGQGLDLTVAIKPGWTGRAVLHVLTSGGVSEIAVSSGSSLSGYLDGEVAAGGGGGTIKGDD